MCSLKAMLAIILCVGIVFSTTSNLFADEASELILKLLVKKGLITQQEVDGLKSELGQAIAREKREVPATIQDRIAKLEGANKASDWAERITMKGDLRYRNEILWINNTNAINSTQRYRQRVRARLAIKGKVNDDVDANLRFVTGNGAGGDPVSTNQTINLSFGTKNLSLDIASIHYHPYSWVDVKAGLFKNPFMGSEMLWDTDLIFGGSVVQLRHDLEMENLPPTEVFATFGVFPLDDLAFTKSDPFLLGAQGGFKTKLTDNVNWNFAAAFFPYLNVKDQNLANNNTGNSMNGANLTQDYDIVDLYTDVTIKDPLQFVNIDCEHVPALVGFADVAMNASGNDETFAVLGGGLIGHKKVKKWPNWSLAYNYRYIEGDAQFDGFPDADFHNGTNAQGHNIICKLGTLKNTVFAAEWYHTRALEFLGDNDYDNRLQLDVAVKF